MNLIRERGVAMKKKQTVTIYDVAREASVSMATVSRVVNHNHNVKPETEQKVLNVVKKLNYRPNDVARGLASKKTTTVGVIIPNVTNSYFAALARGIDDIAEMYQYNIILTNSDGDEKKEIKALNTLYSKQVDGIIFMGNDISDEVREELRNVRTPVVLAGSVDPKNEFPSVNIDYRKAIYAQFNKLFENGNDRIAFIADNLSRSINKDYRIRGYQDALKDAGVPFRKSLLIEATDVSYESGYKLQERLIKSGATAAIVSNDDVAAGIMNAMGDNRINVPEQFEVATSDNTQLTEMTRPTMSTITQPLYDIGAVSMRLLTKVMDNEEIENNNILLSFGLKKRESTKD
ncbi:catabolite control protein A [Fructilactobacillus lindneri]|uniref:Catabolite control protein A n=2 Tax=Fructilactobacillus lindneri TaxID=53444 RepID=A0A0R2JPU5_9LACO|nr:catabolite control protein A [Fructilactobacillus lindneri DSM 20690 = JCM 11027]POH07794.1 catabolite control protein A [Fructilactobacillus lindneri]POH08105.1 catabolite control protein A [Fructilactobacillus lindneri]POH24618.1 catabolite control protein A [Fructilactobacillus lindneri DSM 20690 = JCM 11027]